MVKYQDIDRRFLSSGHATLETFLKCLLEIERQDPSSGQLMMKLRNGIKGCLAENKQKTNLLLKDKDLELDMLKKHIG